MLAHIAIVSYFAAAGFYEKQTQSAPIPFAQLTEAKGIKKNSFLLG